MDRAEGSEPGVLLVDKPAGAPSFAMVRAVRRLTGIKKVGHAGTLDPFATGLLVICIGRPATKLISQVMEGEKEYVATMQLGAVSTTQDPEGEISKTQWNSPYSQEIIQAVLKKFTGEISQVPPAFSALKHKGKPLYHYARKGIEVKKAARNILIHSLSWEDRRKLVDKNNPLMTIRVVSGKGAYIRSLAADIGQELGCGSYLTTLRRVRSGLFSVEDAIPGEELSFPQNVSLTQEKLKKSLLSLEMVHNLLQ